MIKSKMIRLTAMALISASMFTLSACTESETTKTDTSTVQTTDAAVKTNEEPKYTQDFVGEAKLVSNDGYTVGAAVKGGIIHYIFQVEQDGQTSVDTDVAETYCKVVDINSDDAYKDMMDKVFAYERTYEDGTKHFYYEIYTIDSAIANLGELPEKQEDSE